MPEARIILNGKIYHIGGLRGQEERGFFRKEWLDDMKSSPEDFQYQSYEIGEITEGSEKIDLKILNLVDENLDSLIKTFNNFEIHNYLKNIIQLCSEVNKYVNDSAPWSIKENNFEKRNVIIYTVLEFIRKISILLQPVIPEKTKIILDSLSIKEDERFIKNINSHRSQVITVSPFHFITNF